MLDSQHSSVIQEARPSRGDREDGVTRVPFLVCKLAVRGVASGLAYSRRVQALCARYGGYNLNKNSSKTRL